IERAPHHDWPGNVRELENLIERLMAYASVEGTASMSPEAAQALVQDAAPELFDSVPAAATTGEGLVADAPLTSLIPATPFKTRQAQAERADILRVLAECGGDRALASERLGISRTTLWRKLRG